MSPSLGPNYETLLQPPPPANIGSGTANPVYQGGDWPPLTPPTQANLQLVNVGLELIVTGWTGTQTVYIYESTDGGSTWSVHSSNSTTSPWITVVSFTNQFFASLSGSRTAPGAGDSNIVTP